MEADEIPFGSKSNKKIVTVPSKDMQTGPPPRIVPICMKDTHNAESNEKSIFRSMRFFSFELWLIVFTIYEKITAKKKLFKSAQIYRKDADYFANDFLVHEFFFVRL